MPFHLTRAAVPWILSLTAACLFAEPLPIRGIHLAAPKPADMPLALRLIEQGLGKEGVNVLILEFNYGFRSQKRPEVSEPDALSLDQVRELAMACKKSNIRLIPMINLLGHQSWAKTTFGLLRAHPEFDETPGKYPDNNGIYCRSYCPRQPQVHEVLFDLIDELVDATGANAFHAGMDEVFLLGEDDCPRCRGKNKAELFAGEVKAIHDHLASRRVETWIWGDRLLDGNVTGFGKWEASENQTAPAIGQIPKDVIIADWHYDQAHPTAAYFAINGFRVLSSPWRRPGVALDQLAQIRDIKAHSSPEVADRMLGVLQTSWVGLRPFAQAYFKDGDPASVEAIESVQCFRELFRELRRTE